MLRGSNPFEVVTYVDDRHDAARKMLMRISGSGDQKIRYSRPRLVLVSNFGNQKIRYSGPRIVRRGSNSFEIVMCLDERHDAARKKLLVSISNFADQKYDTPLLEFYNVEAIRLKS